MPSIHHTYLSTFFFDFKEESIILSMQLKCERASKSTFKQHLSASYILHISFENSFDNFLLSDKENGNYLFIQGVITKILDEAKPMVGHNLPPPD